MVWEFVFSMWWSCLEFEEQENDVSPPPPKKKNKIMNVIKKKIANKIKYENKKNIYIQNTLGCEYINVSFKVTSQKTCTFETLC